jgi:hypothetical protein
MFAVYLRPSKQVCDGVVKLATGASFRTVATCSSFILLFVAASYITSAVTLLGYFTEILYKCGGSFELKRFACPGESDYCGSRNIAICAFIIHTTCPTVLFLHSVPSAI